jgi:hypothetical protein
MDMLIRIEHTVSKTLSNLYFKIQHEIQISRQAALSAAFEEKGSKLRPLRKGRN